MMSRVMKWMLAVALALSCALSANAQQEIKIGAIYPLTGPAASTGAELKQAIELAVDIINNGAKNLPNLPFSRGGGLPNLKGAKIKVIFADHQSNPQVGATEAERLITQEKVVALLGCYQSNVTATASQVAERSQIPFLNPESSAENLTQRGFHWFFRTTPHDGLFVENSFQFLREVEQKKGLKIKTIGLLSENTLWGSETAKLENKLAAAGGYNVVKTVRYPQNSTQLTSEIQSLKAANPQLVMQASYLGDAILSMKAYKEMGFLPDMILANDAGFTDSEYSKSLGSDGDYIVTREVWALDLADRNPLIRQVNDLLYSRYHVNFNGNSARSFTGLMVMADAINRAGSTDPNAIRKALAETNLPGNSLIMPWNGVKFDPAGQNTLGAGIIVQLIGGKYYTVWPFNRASHDLVWPMPKWEARK